MINSSFLLSEARVVYDGDDGDDDDAVDGGYSDYDYDDYDIRNLLMAIVDYDLCGDGLCD